MRRFFVAAGTIQSREVTLEAELAHRLGRVLRMKPGDHVLLADGSGREYEVELTSVTGKAAAGTVVAERPAPAEPTLTLVLYPSLIKASRFDFVLEKGTELGVARIVPVVSARSVVRPGHGSAAKQQRWQRLVVEAAEQCGRGRPPLLERPTAFAEAVGSAPGARLLPWEGETTVGMRSFLRGLRERPGTVSLFIGPEGGFSQEEVALARRHGAHVVSLGQRILRAETAAIVAAAIVLHELGELGE